MHHQRIPDVSGTGRPQSPAAEYERDQALVLETALELHPARLTLEEVTLKLTGSHEFEACDKIERAVRDLVASGLLHPHEQFVSPTHAAVCFQRLWSSMP